ncbi:MAG: hypothetical protein M1819_005242 [Sarea resinae]|nr:MAG: hypothetical protein M1819_005242 [Sarea resinae]
MVVSAEPNEAAYSVSVVPQAYINSSEFPVYIIITSCRLGQKHDPCGPFLPLQCSAWIHCREMTDPFGIVPGAFSIAAAFTTCVDCFEYVQLGRHLGRDFRRYQLTLNCARLRLSRWGQAVDIYNDPNLGNPRATRTELQTAQNTLFQILVLFADSEAISKSDQVNMMAAEDVNIDPAGDMDSKLLAINRKMRLLAMKRRKGSSLLHTTRWALYHRTQLKDLVANIIRLIDHLEYLFPGGTSESELVRQEIAQLAEGQDKQTLALVEDASQDVDSLLQKTIRDARTGHQYSNIQVRGQAHNGDSFSDGWAGNATGGFHIYDGIVVETGSRALNGNKYRGKDFWDSS